MVIRSVRQSYELVKPLGARGKTIHGLWMPLQGEDSRLVHIAQIPKADLDRTAIPCIQELEENSALTVLVEMFMEQEFFCLVFHWQDRPNLSQFLEESSLSMEQRFLLGRSVLERMLVLNLPVFLQRDELEPEEILVDPDFSVDFYYGFSDTSRIAGADDAQVQKKVGELTELLFQKEAASGLYPELALFKKALEETGEQGLLSGYQQYLTLAPAVTQERTPPEKQTKEPFFSRFKKKAGLFLKIFQIAAGLTVTAAALVMLLGAWKEKVYPVVESAYLTKTFLSGDDGIAAYTGKVEIRSEDGGTLLYRGRLEDGNRTGYGTEYYRSGDLRYDGNFLGDRYDGQGSYYSQTGKLLYQGGFQAGLYEGNGTLCDESGAVVYEGGFSQGEKEGNGSSYDGSSRLCYEGGFSRGLYEGEGILCRDGSVIYEGGFSRGKPDGEGISYEDGRVREKGRFEKGSFVEGQGFLYDQKGLLLYEGSLAGGKPDGEGTAYEADTVIYEGTFKKGRRHGEGKQYSPQNGRLVYQGGFADGVYDGQGVLYDPVSGAPLYSGGFRLGFYDGEGLEYDPSGNLKYQGNFLLGTYNGYGTLFDPDTGKAAQEGEFRNGVLVTPKEELFPGEKEGGEEEETATGEAAEQAEQPKGPGAAAAKGKTAPEAAGPGKEDRAESGADLPSAGPAGPDEQDGPVGQGEGGSGKGGEEDSLVAAEKG